MRRLLGALLLLCVGPVWADSFDDSGYRTQYLHITQANLVPSATDLSGTAAVRLPATPWDSLRFPSTGDPTAIFQFTYPRNAVVNRFEVEVDAHSSTGTVSDRACLRVAILATSDDTELANNVGGTHVSGGDTDVCCGDVGDDGTTADGTISDCEKVACAWYYDNSLSTPYPGGGGCVAHTTPGVACDCNGDGYVIGTELSLLNSYSASTCPTPPHYEGAQWHPSSVGAAMQNYRDLDAVRAYRQGETEDTVCPDGVATSNSYRSTLCGGLPTVLVLQRLTTGCDSNLSGDLLLDSLHIKYYTE